MATVSLVFLIAAFLGALAFTGKVVYHMYHVVTNITGKYASFLGPLALLLPSQFNAEGNRHRVALGPAIIGVILCWAIILLAKGTLGKIA